MSISVIMPCFNAGRTLRRAVSSVTSQIYPHWELVVVDDRSDDDSVLIAEEFARQDRRITVLSVGDNLGPGAARNLGLKHSSYQWLCYLDADDEFYPNHLGSVHLLSNRCELLICGYDVVEDGVDGTLASGSRIIPWEPQDHSLDLFRSNISTPLGVAHCKNLIGRAGGFNETLWQAEDWELWRRFARQGAELLFSPYRSGIFHIRSDSRSRAPRLTTHQQSLYQANVAVGRPLYDLQYTFHRPARSATTVLFASSCCLLDQTSGAALAVRTTLAAIARHDSANRTVGYCMGKLDSEEEVCLDEYLMALPVECVSGPSATSEQCSPEARDSGHSRWFRVGSDCGEVLLLRAQFTRHGLNVPGEIEQFLTGFDRLLYDDRPDVLLTYGGDPITMGLIQLARRRDIPIVITLHNHAYADVNLFNHVDYAIVPSHFTRRHYWRTLGVHAQVLPNVVDPQRVVAKRPNPKYLTFVNPQPAKGVTLFARLAVELNRRRPDIPLLVVEGRGRAREWLSKVELDLSGLRNLHVMENQADVRRVYGATRVMLVPSVWDESFGLVAAEAMCNGIPVVASDRGALPETVGEGGVCLPIPPSVRLDSPVPPSAAEVEPWVEAVVRLWDDLDHYKAVGEAGARRAYQWHPTIVGALASNFFNSVRHQPGPPWVPCPWPRDD